MKTVTICGSMRFFDRMLKVAADETLAGNIVLMPFCVVPPEHQGVDYKRGLDELHKRKIDMSEEVVVVTDRTTYIGESTNSEIEYAHDRRKTVRIVVVP